MASYNKLVKDCDWFRNDKNFHNWWCSVCGHRFEHHYTTNGRLSLTKLRECSECDSTQCPTAHDKYTEETLEIMMLRIRGEVK